ncbi:hypothetical protein HOLleu_36485 [Holothuria leucospilota]|uniref:Uncharacterized protein n=1 Tax=Holothuria leucospilota TaxID=206669 RepID=A0A9Q0YRE9_HOLLE|nr:hypothetical protein HOLleu_36485 [Holothuria leucospilota]
MRQDAININIWPMCRKFSDSGSSSIQEGASFAWFSCQAVVQSKEPPPLQPLGKWLKNTDTLTSVRWGR